LGKKITLGITIEEHDQFVRVVLEDIPENLNSICTWGNFKGLKTVILMPFEIDFISNAQSDVYN